MDAIEHEALVACLADAVNQAHAIVSGESGNVPLGEFRALLERLQRDLARVSPAAVSTIEIVGALNAISDVLELIVGKASWETTDRRMIESLLRLLESVHVDQL